MNEKSFILNFAPTGMIPSKHQTTFVPISPNEIIEDVHAAFEEGITLVHLHARDEKGKASYKASIYHSIIEGIKKHCKDLVVGVSLSGRDFQEFEKRAEVLSLRPDMASLTLSSLNFGTQASINSPEMIQKLCNEMNKYGVNPELEVFDLGMINYSKYLISKNLITAPFYYNIIVGNVAGLQLDAQHIGTTISSLPLESYWCLGGIGKFQFRSNVLGIALGGGVRVGLEDNIFYDQEKEIKTSNLNLVKRVNRIAKDFDKEVMSSKEFGSLGFYNNSRN